MVGRKNTIWGARHILEEKEIERLQILSKKQYGINLTKLEASALMARKSQRGRLTDKEVKSFIDEMRGATSFDKELGSLF